MSTPHYDAEIGSAREDGLVWDGTDWIDKESIEEIKNCDHDCTSNCRREGCNCACGEYHNDELIEALNNRKFSPEQEAKIEELKKDAPNEL